VYERTALIHHHEIGLTGRNRSAFADHLRADLDFAVRGLADSKTERISSRVRVPAWGRARIDEAVRACAAVPGVASVTGRIVVERGLDAIASVESALDVARVVADEPEREPEAAAAEPSTGARE
jgi:adenylyl- and sulfurtransferase ThiI